MFQYNLLKQAKKERKHIVLPEGNDDRVLIAISRLQEMDVVDLTVIGSKKEIEKRATELNIHIDYSKLISYLQTNLQITKAIRDLLRT
jgi:phosphate acetyltransferase